HVRGHPQGQICESGHDSCSRRGYLPPPVLRAVPRPRAFGKAFRLVFREGFRRRPLRGAPWGRGRGRGRFGGGRQGHWEQRATQPDSGCVLPVSALRWSEGARHALRVRAARDGGPQGHR
ncbi:unnamed protein product, partial [Ectocarpus sp. 12 AP-2014]